MLGKRGEADVHSARREEGFVRPRKGQDAANFASDESLSIVNRDRRRGGKNQRQERERLCFIFRDTGLGRENRN